eukprot:1152122-Pelagomonas_calceolata.AAC.2
MAPTYQRTSCSQVRNKLAGTRSEVPARLAYDRVSGLYYDDPQKIALKSREREDTGQYSWFKNSDGDLISGKDLKLSDGFGDHGYGQVEDVQAGVLMYEDDYEGDEGFEDYTVRQGGQQDLESQEFFRDPLITG